MHVTTFFIIHIILLFAMVILQLWLLSNDKNKYLKVSYKSLESICKFFYRKDRVLDISELSFEINRFYNEFLQENPQIKRIYPNVVVWLDEIIFRIACGEKSHYSQTIYI